MSLFSIQNIALHGLAAAVPAQEEHNRDLDFFTEKEWQKFEQTVGIGARRVAPAHMTAADLCTAAAEKLLAETGIKATEISALVFVSQTPDHLLPGSATQIQRALGISPNAFTLDLNAGCAGYVYGLATLAALQSTMQASYTLLLVGDTITRLLSPQDKSTRPIFSDAGSATLLRHAPGAPALHFNLQSDGNGYQAIHIPHGGSRAPFGANSQTITTQADGLQRSPAHMGMQGMEVFQFGLREVAPNLKTLLDHHQLETEDADYLVLHQANLLLNESIRRKMKFPAERCPTTLQRYGNTSSATIPVTLVDQLQAELSQHSQRLLLSGFGVGLSWGSAWIETEALTVPPMIHLV